MLTGRSPNLAGALLFCDLEYLTFDRIKLARTDTCPVYGKKTTSEPSPIRHETIEEICGREGRRVLVVAPDDDLELDMDALNSRLIDLGYSPDVRAALGTSFSGLSGEKGAILKSGVTILEGVASKEEARRIYDRMVRTGTKVE